MWFDSESCLKVGVLSSQVSVYLLETMASVEIL